MPSTRKIIAIAVLVAAPAALVAGATAAAQAQSIADQYRATTQRIVEAALSDSAAWNRIAELTEKFGSRFSGSEGLEQAIDWIVAQMKADGLVNVRGEPVMVPRWVRGEESAELLAPRVANLPMLGLGGSIGTSPGGIVADVMVVASYDELTRRAAEAKGRIVLFNVPFTNYGETVRYRTGGAVAAARVGAVASMIRSVTPYSMRTLHTGNMSYDSTVTKIPHFAITTEDADMIARLIARGERVRVRVKMSARFLPDAPSRNVMGELRGREFPDEVVALGGHIDSWDVGRGAMDDAGGVVAAWQALLILRKLGLQPRRTIRVVGWVNEENGTRGGNAYRDQHSAEAAKHSLVIESDGGVFRPLGFGFTGSDSAFAIMQQIGSLLDAAGLGKVTRGGGGADIGPIMGLGVPGAGLNVDDTRYFWFHHSEADTVDKLDPREVAQSAAAMAILAYVAADLPRLLPR
ncbi:MAG: M20/M25/M40 family metallo-hydrolase [Gemmatimonadaceae bacterium]|nr:M20/M25/M40 family metallo-hydrolase [Gemmatimonadaceae bacterium]